MKVRISFPDDDRAAELESLDAWLRGEPELAGHVSVAGAKPRAGELGALADALIISVGSGGALSVLAMSLSTWLSQPRRSDVRIRIQAETGEVVEISADRVNVDQVEALLRQTIADRALEE
jgi:hypothetical protein